MKSTGIVRKVDELGRVVIPIELRRMLDIGEKDGLEIYVDGDKIILRKYNRLAFSVGTRTTLRTSGAKRSAAIALRQCSRVRSSKRTGVESCCLAWLRLVK